MAPPGDLSPQQQLCGQKQERMGQSGSRAALTERQNEHRNCRPQVEFNKAAQSLSDSHFSPEQKKQAQGRLMKVLCHAVVCAPAP